MTQKRILTSVTTMLSIVFGALFLSPFFLHSQPAPEVKAVSEQAVYIPSNYQNYGLPLDVVVLPDGNLWYVDVQNGRLVKVSQQGNILRTIGRYGTEEGEFEGEMTSLTRDADENIYVQTFAHTYKLDFNGGFIKKWGILGDGEQDYSNPEFIHYDASSNTILVSDTGHNNVKRFTTDGVYISSIGTPGDADGQLRLPRGVATDDDGNVYIVEEAFDPSKAQVSVFDTNGNFLFKFGNVGIFVAAKDILIKPNGNILVASQNSQDILEFSSAGELIQTWGEQGNNAWQFQAPRGISLDTSGNLFVTDYYLGSIQKFSSSGLFISSVRNSGTVSGKLTSPVAVAYDSTGNVYVLDNGYENARVQKFTNAGTFLSTIIQPPTLISSSYHMTIKNDQIYISSQTECRKFDLNGNLLLTIGSGGSGDGQFVEARGIDIDSAGNIYISDGSHSRVEKFDSNGQYVTQWGTPGTGEGQFGWPESLVIDSSDNIYVADNQGNNINDNARIQVFNTAGVYQKTIASFGGEDGQVFNIGGMVFDAEGKLHVTERYYTKIQVFNADGTYSNKYGETAGINGGGGVEEYYGPNGLALNPISGNISIADGGNHRVQLLPSGTRIYNLISSADVLSSSGNASLVYRYYDPQSSGVDNISSTMFFGDYAVSDFSVNLTDDRNWVNVNVISLPNESKSLIVNLDPDNAPGVSASHSLYIIKQAGQTSVHVCPNAVLIEEVSATCTGGYDLTTGDPELTSVTIGNHTYWKVTGLTGTGIMSPLDVTPTPTATPTTSITATPTATPTSTPTTTGSVTPTPRVTTSIQPLIAAVTLPPAAVKGEKPSCPSFTTYTVSNTLVKKGESVKFAWETKNTEAVRTGLTEVNLPPVGNFTFVPESTTEVTFVADNGLCTAKKTSTIVVVDSLPWTNTITVGTGLLLVEAALALQQPAMFGNVWLAIAGFFGRKKRQTWGIVYNAATKKPLGRVIIRLLREDKTIADTVVSDASGSFRLTPKAGKYTVTAALIGFTFPSTTIKESNDGGFTNVYRGEEISITNAAKNILLSIPLDVATMTEQERARVTAKNRVAAVIEMASNLLMFGGFGYGLYIAYVYPHVYNYIILAVYAFIIVTKLFLMLPKKTVGRVAFADGEPVPGVELGLFDVEFKNLLYRTFTDDEGSYSFVVPNGVYNLKVMDDRYRISIKGQLVKGVQLGVKGKENIRVITDDLTLE